ncbi:hypothetical protein [Bacillus testis]|uniref:hypothetical protein n=1 Tax=Bacillus testis TaxID=1622072 RepID=UPI00067E99B3|nr:hypothetical protein [Bacillus testis]
MNTFQIYNDLLLDIEVLKEQIELCEREKKQWWGGGRLFQTVSLDNAAERVDKLNFKLDHLHEELNIKTASQQRIEGQLKKYKGLEYKVFYGRYIEGKSLKDIAEELNYNYDYIREVACRIRNEQPTISPQTS